MNTKKCGVDGVAMVLVIIGALNWGLVGFFGFNFVDKIFSSVPMVAKIVYMLVGLSGLWALYGAFRCCKKCK